MNPYTILSSGVGTTDATSLGERLSAWHDAMVTHERKRRTGRTTDLCDDECPHAEARHLWPEAIATFGARAQELTFLRSSAMESVPTLDASNHKGREEIRRERVNDDGAQSIRNWARQRA